MLSGPSVDVARLFLQWTWLRAVLHRGWWLVTSLYLVLVADLTASELVLYIVAMSVTMLLAEVPTGIVADTVSRKRSLVIAHLVMGAGMVLTGLVTAFEWFVIAQVLWGLGWTFSSGADIAWVTDELDQPDRIDRVLVAHARWEKIGSACGTLVFGGLAWATDLTTAVLTAGVGMLILGLAVQLSFPERNFVPRRVDRLREAAAVLRGGFALARHDREITLVLAATFLLNGGGTAFGSLFPKHLLGLGLPSEPHPVVWFTALRLVMLALAALALRVVEARIDGHPTPRRDYAVACLVGTLGLLLLAAAPEDVTAVVGVLLVGGAAEPVTRALGTVWVNRRATSEVRTTVHSFLSQAEAFGEIVLGSAVAILAGVGGIPLTLAAAGGVFALAGLLVARSAARERRR